jgi:hypothetical protein
MLIATNNADMNLIWRFYLDQDRIENRRDSAFL